KPPPSCHPRSASCARTQSRPRPSISTAEPCGRAEPWPLPSTTRDHQRIQGTLALVLHQVDRSADPRRSRYRRERGVPPCRGGKAASQRPGGMAEWLKSVKDFIRNYHTLLNGSSGLRKQACPMTGEYSSAPELREYPIWANSTL